MISLPVFTRPRVARRSGRVPILFLTALGNEEYIEVSLALEENVACLSVYNCGPPIPAEELPYLWGPFYQEDRSRGERRHRSGAGHCSGGGFGSRRQLFSGKPQQRRVLPGSVPFGGLNNSGGLTHTVTHTGKQAGGINGVESAKDHARPEQKGPQSTGKWRSEGWQSVGKDEVPSSNLGSSSRKLLKSLDFGSFCFIFP